MLRIVDTKYPSFAGKLRTRAGRLFSGLLLTLFALAPSEGFCELKTTGATQVSIANNGSAPEFGKENVEPVIAHGSELVIFSSLASNLTASTQSENTSRTHNIFLYNRHTSPAIELVSAIPTGQAPRKVAVGETYAHLDVGCVEPAVSEVAEDGSFAVAFTSDANDLIDDYEPPTGDGTIGPPQVYLRIYRPVDGGDSLEATTLLVSEAYSSTASYDYKGADARSDQPTIVRFPSDDDSVSHRFTVCFRSKAPNFLGLPPTTLEKFTVYCRHGIGFDQGTFVSGTRSKIPDADSDFAPPPGAVGHHSPQLSRDGRWLTFSSDLPLLQGYSASSGGQVYLYAMNGDANDERLSLVSFGETDTPASGTSAIPSISHDGTYVAFVYTQHPGGDTNALKGFSDRTRPFFVRYNTRTKTYLQINSDAEGQPSNGLAYSGRLDDSGRYAVFSDTGSNLVGSPESTTSQVFFKDLEPTGLPSGGRLIGVSVSPDPELEWGSNHSGRPPTEAVGRHVSIGSFVQDGATKFLTAFTSFAPNFRSVGFPSSAPYIFSSSVLGDFDDPPAPNPTATPTPTPTPTPLIGTSPGVGDPKPLTANIPIEDPPLVEVLPSRKPNNFSVRIICQPFTISRRTRARGVLTELATRKSRVKYTIEIRKAGSRRRITQVSSRNVVTVRKLTPGQYTIRYRVSAQTGKRTIRSQKSPPATIVLT